VRRSAVALIALCGTAAVAAPAAVAARPAAPERPVAVAAPVTTAHLSGTRHGPARLRLTATGSGGGEVDRTLVRVDGGRWRTYRPPTPDVLFDGSRASFRRWQHVGSGSFRLQRDGTLRTVGGLGMLWYPKKQYGDAEIHLQWRALPAPKDAADGASHGNSGVFIRFPDPIEMTSDPTKRRPCQAGVGLASPGLLLPAFAAFDCGNEIQINDSSPADPQRTGSVYDFSFLHDPQQRPVPVGTWTDYRIRVVGGGHYAVTVIRDGHVINEWVNTPGQLGWRSGCYCGVPAEYPGDPISDVRQFARGYFGLQNHSDTDVVEFRRVTVRDLSGHVVTVRGRGEHVVRYRSIDTAGHVEPLHTVRFTIGGRSPGADPAAGAAHGCTAGPVVASSARTVCTYVATGDGSYDAQTTGVWSITVTHGHGPDSTTTLVAVHPSAPSLPVSGTFHAEKGDVVTVTLGPDLTTARDSNIALDGAVGRVTAGDRGA
jgi:hypothetical protein